MKLSNQNIYNLQKLLGAVPNSYGGGGGGGGGANIRAWSFYGLD
jgi:hypothetical protein